MRVLLIGFGPFPGAPLNPSALLVKSLARRRRPAFAEIVRTTHVFATTYAAVDRDLPRLLAAGPDIVLMFGVAGRRRHLCIETRARNAISLLFPDASGYRPRQGIIAPGEPAALRSAAPFARLLGAVRASTVPALLSRDAGRYLCNYAYWRALERSRDGRPLVQFVHIPGVSLGPRRQRHGRRSPPLGALVAGAERLLIVLIAASRR
jgi:pyroglutamyl-peptidase